MKIAVLKERRADERRVAATPETVKKFVGLGVACGIDMPRIWVNCFVHW